MYLVGALEHDLLCLPILGMSSSQLTNPRHLERGGQAALMQLPSRFWYTVHRGKMWEKRDEWGRFIIKRYQM